MTPDDIPAVFLPMAWTGTVCTTLTYVLLALAGVDPARITRLLGAKNEFVPALLIYTFWTSVSLAALLLLLEARGIAPASLGLHGPPSTIGLPAGIAAGVACAAAGVGLWWLVEWIAVRAGGRMYRAEHLDSRHWPSPSAREAVGIALLGAVLVPVAEEIIFRGYAQEALIGALGSVPAAVALTALLFAAIHGAYGVGVIAYAFLLSLLLSGLVLATGSLYPAIAAHALINLWSFVIVPILAARRAGTNG